MRGFIVGFIGLTLLEVALAGQTSGKGGNISSLLSWPAAMAGKFLDPSKPFFTVSAAASSSSSSSSSGGTTLSSLSGPLTSVVQNA